MRDSGVGVSLLPYAPPQSQAVPPVLLGPLSPAHGGGEGGGGWEGGGMMMDQQPLIFAGDDGMGGMGAGGGAGEGVGGRGPFISMPGMAAGEDSDSGEEEVLQIDQL